MYVPSATAGIGIVVWVAAIVAFNPQLLILGARIFGPENPNIIRPVLLLPVILAMFIASALSHRPVRNDQRLICAQCGRLLRSPPARMIVIASCNCPYCGSQVLEGSP
jgi:DNA-directed RNA polymerase subunit RPC12/RpoP